MWFIALVFIITPAVLIVWWLKLLYANRNVPYPKGFGESCCSEENNFLDEGFINNMSEHSHRITHGYYD